MNPFQNQNQNTQNTQRTASAFMNVNFTSKDGKTNFQLGIPLFSADNISNQAKEQIHPVIIKKAQAYDEAMKIWQTEYNEANTDKRKEKVMKSKPVFELTNLTIDVRVIADKADINEIEI